MPRHRVPAPGLVHLVAAAAAVTTLSIPDRASAGGLEYPDLGTVAIGRGTAFVARADNGLAFHYNPAGLSKQPRGSVLLSANLVQMSVEFQRAGDDTCMITDDGGACLGGYNPSMDWSQTRVPGQMPMPGMAGTRPYESVSMNGMGPAPVIAGSYTGIGKAKGLSLALGVIPPSSFGTPRYPKNGPQRYMVQHSNILALFPGVGVAYNFNRYFQVGAVFLSGITTVHAFQAARLNPQPNNPLWGNEDLGGDAQFELKANDFFMPSGILGVLSHPTDWLEIGASARLPVNVEAKGTVDLVPPESEEQDAEIAGDDTVILRQKFPWVVRAGVRYIHKYFDVEADFVYEAWSQLQEFEVDFVDCDPNDIDKECTQVMTAGGPVDLVDTKIPKNYRDTYSVRLGGDVALWPGHLTGRAGGFYQSSSFPKNYETMNLDFPFGEQYGVGGGLTWHAIQYLDVTVGFMHVFQKDVKVTEGIVQQASNPTTGPDGERLQPGNVVNNGTYKVGLNLFGASFQGRF